VTGVGRTFPDPVIHSPAALFLLRRPPFQQILERFLASVNEGLNEQNSRTVQVADFETELPLLFATRGVCANIRKLKEPTLMRLNEETLLDDLREIEQAGLEPQSANRFLNVLRDLFVLVRNQNSVWRSRQCSQELVDDTGYEKKSDDVRVDRDA
jgi:hypothetical protein